MTPAEQARQDDAVLDARLDSIAAETHNPLETLEFLRLLVADLKDSGRGVTTRPVEDTAANEVPRPDVQEYRRVLVNTLREMVDEQRERAEQAEQQVQELQRDVERWKTLAEQRATFIHEQATRTGELQREIESQNRALELQRQAWGRNIRDREAAEQQVQELQRFAAEMSGLITDMGDVPDPGLEDLPGMAEAIRGKWERAEATNTQLREWAADVSAELAAWERYAKNRRMGAAKTARALLERLAALAPDAEQENA